MTNILDRMLFFTVVRSYFICLISTLSLYIIVDLFTNLDDFTGKANGFADSVRRITVYYGYRTVQYFDRLAEVLALLAAMFTVAWMQRNNELLPQLSAGVGTRRIIRPILFAACCFITLGSMVQEFILPLPTVANALQADRDDLDRLKDVYVQGLFDTNGVHLEGLHGNIKDSRVNNMYVTIPEMPTNGLMHLSASTAHYIAPDGTALSGGWLLSDTTPAVPGDKNNPPMLVHLDAGKYFLKTQEVTFESLTRRPKWADYLSTERIYEVLQGSDDRKDPALAVTFHMRATRPIIGMLLVVMGLSIILRDQTRHVFISTGMCLGTCALFYGVVFGCKFLGGGEFISPPLAAWLPVIIFGPLTLSSYDAIHT